MEAHQAPPSLEFSRKEHWSGLPFPSPGDLPDPGMEPASSELQAVTLPLSHQGRQSLYVCPVSIYVYVLSRSVVSDSLLSYGL